MADSIGGDMIRGHIDSIILNSLLDGDKDTNQIRTEIENKAGGDFKLKQGTFYSALQRISKQGFVTEYRTSGADGVRRKFFQLTEKGKAHIEKSQFTWSQSQNVINKLLDSEQPDIPARLTAAEPRHDDIKIPSFEEQPIVTDFFDLTNPTDEHPDESPILNYDEIRDEQPSSSLPFEEEKTSVQPSDSDVNGLLNILDSDSAQDKSIIDDNVDTIDDKVSNSSVSIYTYEYFDGSIEKSVNNEKTAIASNVAEISSMVESSDEENKDLLKEKESFETIVYGTDEYEPEYNCDISTDLFSKSIKNECDSVKSVDLEKLFVDENTQQPAASQSNDLLNSCDNPESNDSARLKDSQSSSNFEKTKYEQLSLDATVNLSTESSFDSKSVMIDKIDDFVANADELPEDKYPDQPSYRDILSRIIEKKKPKEPQPPLESQNINLNEPISKVIEFPQIDIDEPVTNEIKATEPEVVVENLNFNSQTQSIEKDNNVQKKTASKSLLRPKNGFDYSDIISLSEEEGFKISTSDKTNKSELGKILLNKLNFHSSVLFFTLICLETLIVGLTMNSILRFPTYSYFLFGLAVFIFPLVSGIIYYISPKRAVAEIRPFKSAFETALIITLELLIAILMVIVIRNLDFSNYADVARTLFVPLLIVINVPIYVIIKYSLLDRQQYFS